MSFAARSHAPHWGVAEVPRSIVLGELAIAAGIAGRSLTFWHQDYSGPALYEMWKYLLRGFGPDAVFHVRSQADVRSLGERLADIRGVLIHASRLHATVAWRVQMGAPNAAATMQHAPGDIIM